MFHRSMLLLLMLYRCCCVSAGAFEVQSACGLESSSSFCVEDGMPTEAHSRTNTAVAPFVAVSRKEGFEVLLLLRVPCVLRR